MRKFIYMLMIILLFVMGFAGCVSQDKINKSKDDIDDLEDEISEMDDDNEMLQEDIDILVVQIDAALERNEGQRNQIEKMPQDIDGTFNTTFSEVYAQLAYLSVFWEMDMFKGPKVMNMDNGNTNHAWMVYYGDSDTTLSNFEVYIETEPETSKVVNCTVVIVQDEQYRGTGDAYNIGYKGITEIVLSALLLSLHSPYDTGTITLDLLEGVQANDKTVCKEFGIAFDVYEDAESEARMFIPYE